MIRRPRGFCPACLGERTSRRAPGQQGSPIGCPPHVVSGVIRGRGSSGWCMEWVWELLPTQNGCGFLRIFWAGKEVGKLGLVWETVPVRRLVSAGLESLLSSAKNVHLRGGRNLGCSQELNLFPHPHLSALCCISWPYLAAWQKISQCVVALMVTES